MLLPRIQSEYGQGTNYMHARYYLFVTKWCMQLRYMYTYPAVHAKNVPTNGQWVGL